MKIFAMTDQSRVEAVARAIAVFVGNDPDARQLGRKESPLLWELHKSCAQVAIEANDAWLEECRTEQAKLTPKYCPKCGHPSGQRMVWHEEPDQ